MMNANSVPTGNLYTMSKIRILILAIVSLWCLGLHAEDGKPSFVYKTVSVLDGDTFIATDGNVTFRVRIAAMDAPEKGQPYSKMATSRLKQILMSGNVVIKPIDKGHDRYGRVLGMMFVGKEDVALTMIQAGLATYYRPSCRDYPADRGKYNYEPEKYIQAEHEARELQKNFWSGPKPTLPCRQRNRFKD